VAPGSRPLLYGETIQLRAELQAGVANCDCQMSRGALALPNEIARLELFPPFFPSYEGEDDNREKYD
jgi:hypothetical protein